MSSPGPGRRCWAARRRTACWRCRRARSRGWNPTRPPWPLPKIFRLTKGGKLIEGIFKGETINTPSMLCVEDALDGLRWAEQLGGLPALIARTEANLAAIAGWVARTDWVDFLAQAPATRSPTSICLKITAPWFTALAPEAQAEGGEADHRRCWRRKKWPTTSPITAMPRRVCASGPAPRSRPRMSVALLPWLDWAYGEIAAGYAPARAAE